MSQSVAALVHGFATFDPAVRVAGVVLNRVGSPTATSRCCARRSTPLGVPVSACSRRDDGFAWRDRHLGLVPVVEQPTAIAASLDRLAAAVDARLRPRRRSALARRRPAARRRRDRRCRDAATGRRRCAIAVAGGPAFSFTYPDNLEALAAAGAEIVPFDPLPRRRAAAGGATGCVAGGGFPEVYAAELAANRRCSADVRRRVRTRAGGVGRVRRAAVAGRRRLDGRPMAGVVADRGRDDATA